MVFKKLKITINMKKKFRFMLKKILFGFLIIMFLNPSTLQAANYPFDYLLCDSLKNANYNFGIENRKNKLIIHKLKNNNIKKSTVYLSKDNKINLSEKNIFVVKNFLLYLLLSIYYFLSYFYIYHLFLKNFLMQKQTNF